MQTLLSGLRRWLIALIVLTALVVLGWSLRETVGVPRRELIVAGGLTVPLSYRPVSAEEAGTWSREEFVVHGARQVSLGEGPLSTEPFFSWTAANLFGAEVAHGKCEASLIPGPDGTSVLGYEKIRVVEPSILSPEEALEQLQLIFRWRGGGWVTDWTHSGEGRLERTADTDGWKLRLAFRRLHPRAGAEEAVITFILGPKTAVKPLIRDIQVERE